MKGKTIILYGLPGAGKSTLTETFRTRGLHVFDDFMANSHGDQPGFLYCRHLADIVANLRGNAPSILADIRLCDSAFREEVVAELSRLAPEGELEWHCFDCRGPDAVETCRHNVHHRARVNCKDESRALGNIEIFAPMFTIEQDSILHTLTRAI